MPVLSNLSHRIARSPGDPKVQKKGPSSLTVGDRLARALALFSVGLGVAEVVAPQSITRAIGLDGKEGLIRAYGLREMSSAVPTFSIDKQIGLMMRVVGDGIDLATVAPALKSENPRRGNASLALLALVAITALDIIAVAATAATHKRSAAPPRDYGDRSGLPRGVAASRGLARRDFHTPPDMRAPGTVAEQLPVGTGAGNGHAEGRSG